MLISVCNIYCNILININKPIFFVKLQFLMYLSVYLSFKMITIAVVHAWDKSITLHLKIKFAA